MNCVVVDNNKHQTPFKLCAVLSSWVCWDTQLNVCVPIWINHHPMLVMEISFKCLTSFIDNADMHEWDIYHLNHVQHAHWQITMLDMYIIFGYVCETYVYPAVMYDYDRFAWPLSTDRSKCMLDIQFTPGHAIRHPKHVNRGSELHCGMTVMQFRNTELYVHKLHFFMMQWVWRPWRTRVRPPTLSTPFLLSGQTANRAAAPSATSK